MVSLGWYMAIKQCVTSTYTQDASKMCHFIGPSCSNDSLCTKIMHLPIAVSWQTS